MTVATLDNITLDFGGASDHGLCARFTSAADVVVTVRADTFWTGTDEYWANNSVPLNQGPMPDGGSAIFGKHGAGKITFVADPGVTLNYPDSLTVSRLNAKVTLIKVGPNEWDLDGHFDLA
jgi:hypothetical protein